MDDEKVQVPVSNRGSAAPSTGRSATERGTGGKNKKLKNKHVVAIASVVVVLALLAFGLWNVYRTTTGAQIDSGKYQAVFFPNGHTYFGKLQNLNGSYMKLTNVFYLQTSGTSGENAENPQEADNQNNLQLVKLGNELHGPEDEMIISKDQILFFENLKRDGRVTQSIIEYYGDQNRQ